MAIVITVEDGTNVAGANSLVSVADARAYATNRGVTLSADDDTVASQLIKAMDYINSFRARYKGTKTYDTQTLQFPRTDLYVDGIEVAEDTVPTEAISAQCEAVIAISQGTELFVSTPAGELPVIRDKVDVLETEYASPRDLGGTSIKRPWVPAADALLEPLFKTAGLFSTVRA